MHSWYGPKQEEEAEEKYLQGVGYQVFNLVRREQTTSFITTFDKFFQDVILLLQQFSNAFESY